MKVHAFWHCVDGSSGTPPGSQRQAARGFRAGARRSRPAGYRANRAVALAAALADRVVEVDVDVGVPTIPVHVILHVLLRDHREVLPL